MPQLGDAVRLPCGFGRRRRACSTQFDLPRAGAGLGLVAVSRRRHDVSRRRFGSRAITTTTAPSTPPTTRSGGISLGGACVAQRNGQSGHRRPGGLRCMEGEFRATAAAAWLGGEPRPSRACRSRSRRCCVIGGSLDLSYRSVGRVCSPHRVNGVTARCPELRRIADTILVSGRRIVVAAIVLTSLRLTGAQIRQTLESPRSRELVQRRLAVYEGRSGGRRRPVELRRSSSRRCSLRAVPMFPTWSTPSPTSTTADGGQLDLPHDWGIEGPFEPGRARRNGQAAVLRASAGIASISTCRRATRAASSISTSTARCRTPTSGSTATTSAAGRTATRRGGST